MWSRQGICCTASMSIARAATPPAKLSSTTIQRPALRCLPSIAFRTMNSTTVRGLVFYCGSFTARNFQKRLASTLGLVQGGVWKNSYLREKHAFGSAKQPKATLRHNDYDFKTGATTTNVLGLASHKQRKAAQATALAQRSEAKKNVSAREQRLERMLAKHHSNVLLVCDKCDATFQRKTWLSKHKQAKCGRHLKRMQRRQQLLNESVEKRLEVLDEAELQEACARHDARSDRITMALTAPSGQLGWALHTKLGNVRRFRSKTQRRTGFPSQQLAESRLAIVCVALRSASRQMQKKAFGVHWREHYHYGREGTFLFYEKLPTDI